MTSLIPMEPNDYANFMQKAIDVYAQDNIKSGTWKPEETVEKSREEFNRLLPDGLKTQDQFLFSIIDEKNSNRIGDLWVQVKMSSPHRRAFICDFIIDPQYRGQGYGKSSLQALDEKLAQMNVESVSLHVFAHNTTAVSLYEKMGFSATNLYMSKKIIDHSISS